MKMLAVPLLLSALLAGCVTDRAAQAPSELNMHEPIGFSGVHTVPNSLQSWGRLIPRRMAAQSQALWSGTGR